MEHSISCTGLYEFIYDSRGVGAGQSDSHRHDRTAGRYIARITRVDKNRMATRGCIVMSPRKTTIDRPDARNVAAPESIILDAWNAH